MRRFSAIFVFLGPPLVLALLLLTPAAVGAVVAKEVKVEMKDSVFAPAQTTLQVGDTITFTNSGQLPHTATAKDKSWDTGNVNPGESKTVTFSKQGSFDFICTYHESQGMVGKIAVAAGPAAASPAAPAAAAPVASPAAPSPVPEGSPAAEPSPEGSPEVQEAQPQDPNATIPIGLKLFPFAAIGLVALFALIAGAGYIRSILSTTENR